MKHLAALFSQPTKAEGQEKKLQDYPTKPTKPVLAVLSVRESGVLENSGINSCAPKPCQNQHQAGAAISKCSPRVGLASQRHAIPQMLHEQVEPPVAAEIRRVEDQARALGWPQWRLWESRFWPGPRGLAAVMEPGDQVMELTAEWIKIRKRDGIQQRFYRFDG